MRLGDGLRVQRNLTRFRMRGLMKEELEAKEKGETARSSVSPLFFDSCPSKFIKLDSERPPSGLAG